MNYERYDKLVETLKEKESHFGWCTWFGSNSCGTTACVAGWAMLIDRNLDEETDGASLLRMNEDINLDFFKDWLGVSKMESCYICFPDINNSAELLQLYSDNEPLAQLDPECVNKYFATDLETALHRLELVRSIHERNDEKVAQQASQAG